MDQIEARVWPVADFKYDEFGTQTEDGYDTSEPTDPDDWVAIDDDVVDDAVDDVVIVDD